MLLPIILPTPMSVCPFLIAIIEVISSGKEVPIAMTVIPIILSDRPNDCARITAFSIVSQAPTPSSATPIPISPPDLA